MTEQTKPAPITLPVFGPGAWFVAVEGEPVSVSNGEVRVWRDGKPEPFSAESAIKGDDIDEARFRQIVAEQSKSGTRECGPVELPVFGPKALFFDVDGDPVSFDKGVALRWVDGKPEPTSGESAALRGVNISASRFRQVVAEGAASAIADNLRPKTGSNAGQPDE